MDGADPQALRSARAYVDGKSPLVSGADFGAVRKLCARGRERCSS
jgi:hypothetical protein